MRRDVLIDGLITRVQLLGVSRWALPQILSFLVRSEAIACESGLCFSPEVYFFDREISEMNGLSGVKFCTMVSTRPCFITPIQKFGGHTSK